MALGSFPCRYALFVSLILLAASSASAQLPATRLSTVFPAGATLGKSAEVTIAGADLDDVDRLHFSHPGVTAKQKMAEPGPFDKGPRPVASQFVVSVAGNVAPGVYEVRAAGKYGMSNPRAFTVSDIPEAVEIEPNNVLEEATEFTLPAVINGQSNRATDKDFFKFKAAAGQRIIVNCHARRIDSRVDAVVRAYDAAGRQLGDSRDDQGGDPFIDFTASVAGDYYLQVYDSSYQGGDGFGYRVSVGVLPHIDFVFPPAGAAGGNRPFTLYGRNLPSGRPAGLNVGGRPLQKISVTIPIPGGAAAQALRLGSRLDPASAALDATEFRVKGAQGSSHPVLVGVASAPPVMEKEPNNSPARAQKVTAPCELMGQFYPLRDRDWFQFEAKQGASFTLEIISQRMGVRANPRLVVQRVVKPAEGDEKEQVQQLAAVFESGGTHGGPEFDVRHDDPSYRFTAPADGVYRVMVGDSFGDVTPDPRRVYRLAITSGQPDFRLAAVPEGSHSAVLLRKGGQIGIRVVAFRRDGFDSEIQVSATQLPAGVTSSTAVIGPAQHAAMISLSAAANAAPATGLIQVLGKARIGNGEVTRTARFGAATTPTAARNNSNQVLPSVDARLARNLAVSVSATEAALFTLQAGGGKVIEVSRGARPKIPFTRGGSFKGKINFMPRGLPPNVTVRAGAINPNVTSGQFQIDLRANTPTGTYTFYLDAIAEQVNYARNPEAAAAAAQRKKAVDQIKTQADAIGKAATSAKAAADKLATDTANGAKAAANAKTAADQALAAAKAQQGADAAAKIKAATAKVAAAQKALNEANAKAKAAADAKVESDKKAAEATGRAQLAAQLKARTDKRATDTANAAKPKKRNVPLVSTPITLKITPAPITLAQPKPAGPIKQGAKLEVPLAITRLYAYKGQVNITTAAPKGVSGISVGNVSIPANQTGAKLTITAAANATDGEHEFTVRATCNLNGQNLTIGQPLRLTVQKVAKKKK